MSSFPESIVAHTNSGNGKRFDFIKPSTSQLLSQDLGFTKCATSQCNGEILLNKPILHNTSPKAITGELHPFDESQHLKPQKSSDISYNHEQLNASLTLSLPGLNLSTDIVRENAHRSVSGNSETSQAVAHCKTTSRPTSQTLEVHGKACHTPTKETQDTTVSKKSHLQRFLYKDIIPEASSFRSDEKSPIRWKDEKVDAIENSEIVYFDLKSGSRLMDTLCPRNDDLKNTVCRKSDFVTDDTEEDGHRKKEGCGKIELIIGVVVALLVLMTFLVGTVVQLQVRVNAMEKMLTILMASSDGIKFIENSGLQNFISDNGDLFSKVSLFVNINDDWKDNQMQLSNNEEKSHILFRHTREVVPRKDKTVPEAKKQQTSSGKQDAKNKGNNKAATLESAQFEFDFFDEWYDYRNNFTKQDCFQDKRWPTQPFACKGSTIRYPQSDSALAFYVPQAPKHTGPTHKTRKRKGNRPLVEISNSYEGYFSVRESGVYLIHLNIMIVDETHSHSLSIFLNNLTMLACPRGGFRCPHTNAEGSYKYRICNIDGILEMNINDQLQIRTMEPNTTVRFDSKRKSQFRAVLLHKSTKTNS